MANERLTDLSAMSDAVANNDLLHLVDVSDNSQDPAGSSFKATRSQIASQNFADATARGTAIPGFIGQYGIQVDTGVPWKSSGTAAGNWVDLVKVGKVIWVDTVNGSTIANGATGAITNKVSTVSEARTLAAALTPSTTNRILIRYASGDYTGTTITLDNYIDHDLSNTTNFKISDGGVSCDSHIYGDAILDTVSITHASSVVSIKCNKINPLTTAVALTGGGTINMYGHIAHTVGGKGISAAAGTVNMYGNIICAIGVASHAVNLSGTASVNVYNSTLSADGTNTVGVANSGSGTLTFIGCTILIGTTGIRGANVTAGTHTYRNCRFVVTNTNTSTLFKSGGTLIVDNCTFVATGAGNGIAASTAQDVYVYGACQSNKAISVNVTQKVGTITVSTDVI